MMYRVWRGKAIIGTRLREAFILLPYKLNQ